MLTSASTLKIVEIVVLKIVLYKYIFVEGQRAFIILLLVSYEIVLILLYVSPYVELISAS